MGKKASLLLMIGLMVSVWAPAAGLDPSGPPGPFKHLRKGHDRPNGPSPDCDAPGVLRTGQTACWDGSGNPIDCSATGQDGDHQAGVSVSPRFTDNGDGTVLDNATGLIWLTEANCFGVGNWDHALNSANTLADGACGLTDGSLPGDWRLPNARELHSLIDFGESFPAFPAGHPFLGIQPNYYWSSTSQEGHTDRAWLVGIHEGHVWVSRYHAKRTTGFVWPIRTGLQAEAVCHAAALLKTGQTRCWDLAGLPVGCWGTGQDGEHQAGISVSPRFTDGNDGTVKDNATGLVWLKQASCFGVGDWELGLESANTLADGACGLTDGSAPGDWRMPNARELHSLIDYGTLFPALPPGHPFTGVIWQRSWSSTTLRSVPERAWVVGLNIGGIWDGRDNCIGECTSGLKHLLSYTWPVRAEP